MRTLIAVPVYNEQKYVTKVLDEIRRYANGDILVIDDGSTDQTPLLLAQQPVDVVRHAQNRGYGQSLIDAFRWTLCNRYDWLITMDCDEQHEPASLPDFHRAIEQLDADVISGSRYLDASLVSVGGPPADRRSINATLTQTLNRSLGLSITDAFCGYKAYRVRAVRHLMLDETGYAFPIQFWVQCVANGLRIKEIPVRLIYKDPNRSFGAVLDNPEHRLRHYEGVLQREMEKFPGKFPGKFPVTPAVVPAAARGDTESAIAEPCNCTTSPQRADCM